MTQNTSTAVMQRRSEARDSLDDFPTPPWAVRALCEHLGDYERMHDLKCREPAANRGHMARTLGEYFGAVEASDVQDYGTGFPVRDYLFGPIARTDWTITNPPFRLAQQFIERALGSSDVGVAMFVRSAFLEGTGRYKALFQDKPPTDILQFTERVVLQKGAVKNPNVAVRTWSEKQQAWVMRKPSTATAYCWLVWDQCVLARSLPPRFHWIAPCRGRLERPGDYTHRGP